jgi:prepilin-type N-terminal cleavage/methylation domain-containing protein
MSTRAKVMRGGEAGFTLIEVLISITIFGLVLAAGIGFVATQNRMFQRGLDRMSALQNLRYALNTLETDLPTLGTNVPAAQPSLVYASSSAIAFSADYASNVANDIFASYVDLGAPTGQVTVPDPTLTIPTSSFSWPSTLYLNTSGTRSQAELLVFWFAADSTTARTDDYVLWRQVNDGAAEPVARNLLQNGSTPFFSYLERNDFVNAASNLTAVPASALPLRHTSTFHRVSADTAASARTDSVRAVEVTFRSTNGLTGTNERIVTASRMIALPNAGFELLRTCGDEPIMGGTIGATPVDLGGGVWAVRLTWNAATDETGGERDVARYVIFRQALPITTDWGDPYLSIPAGFASYQQDDASVVSGVTYQYAIAAQDCTPLLSTLVQSPLVIIP